MGIFTRRGFIKTGGVVVGTGLLGACSKEDPYHLTKPPVLEKGWNLGAEKTVATACGQCAASCGILVRVVEGRAVKIEGNTQCPINEGGVGPRGASGVQVLYDPDRITQPLRRKGPRGSATFEPISWDDAMKEVSQRIAGLREKGEPHRLGVVCGKERGLMYDAWQRFSQVYGTPNFFDAWSTADGAVANAVLAMQGVHEIPAYDWTRTRYILSLGSGVLSSSCQQMYFTRAQASMRLGHQGVRCKIVHLEPFSSKTALNADEWIPVNPGTYGAFALGIAHILVREGLHDKAFVEEHCLGFEPWTDEQGVAHAGFRELLQEYAPARVSEICGVPEKLIERTAREMIDERPSFAIVNGQGTLSSNGLHTAMAVHALNALLGSLDQPGGVLVQRPAGIQPLPEISPDETAQKGLKEARLDGAEQLSPFSGSILDRLPQALVSGKPYALDTMFLYYANPLYSRANPGQWKKALAAVPFVVSFSPFMDETAAQMADLILPDTTYLERWEDAAPAPSVGYPVFGLRRPVVKPLYDTKATGDVVIELAKAIDLGDAFPWKDFKALLLSGLAAEEMAEMKKKLVKEGFWSEPSYSFGQWDAVLKTPSGKFEFFSQSMWKSIQALAQKNGTTPDELVKSWGRTGPADQLCTPRYEDTRWTGQTGEGTVSLYPYRLNTYAEGSGANLPWLQEIAVAPGYRPWTTTAEIHPDTAAKFKLQNGDRVRLESQVGQIEVPVRLNSEMMRDMVAVPQGGGHTEYGRWAKGWGANVMQLVSAEGMDLVAGVSPLHGTRVTIRRVSS